MGCGSPRPKTLIENTIESNEKALGFTNLTIPEIKKAFFKVQNQNILPHDYLLKCLSRLNLNYTSKQIKTLIIPFFDTTNEEAEISLSASELLIGDGNKIDDEQKENHRSSTRIITSYRNSMMANDFQKMGINNGQQQKSYNFYGTMLMLFIYSRSTIKEKAEEIYRLNDFECENALDATNFRIIMEKIFHFFQKTAGVLAGKYLPVLVVNRDKINKNIEELAKRLQDDFYTLKGKKVLTEEEFVKSFNENKEYLNMLNSSNLRRLIMPIVFKSLQEENMTPIDFYKVDNNDSAISCINRNKFKPQQSNMVKSGSRIQITDDNDQTPINTQQT